MKSYDLVNWETVNYVYAQLEEDDKRALKNGANDYACGSWASSIRYDKYEGRYYVCFTCESTRKTYIFSTADIENGPWHRSEFSDLMCYDNGLLFVDNGASIDKYDIYVKERWEGSTLYGEVWCVPLIVNPENHDVTHGEPFQLIDHGNFEEPPTGLKGEGYHSYKIGDYYYIMMIQGEGGRRQEIMWRKKTLDGEDVPGLAALADTVVRNGWECKKIFIGDILNDKGEIALTSNGGIAQGCIVDTADGRWYSMLFQDTGAVGRIPVLMPMEWADGWPVIGNGGTSINEYYEKPVQGKERKSIVVSDDFTNGETRRYFSDTETEGITAGIKAEDLPGKTAAEIAQNEYGYVAVTVRDGKKYIVMNRAQAKDDSCGKDMEVIPFDGNRICLGVNCELEDRVDQSTFCYSLDEGKTWKQIGDTVLMSYDWPDFVGYRFGLFC